MQLLGKLRSEQQKPENQIIFNNNNIQFNIQTLFQYSTIKALQQEFTEQLTNNAKDKLSANLYSNYSNVFKESIIQSNLLESLASHAQARIYIHDQLY